MDVADKNGDGFITKNEFVVAGSRSSSGTRVEQKGEMAFKLMDRFDILL